MENPKQRDKLQKDLKKDSGPETDARFRRGFPLGRVSCAIPSESSIPIARTARTARKLHLLLFLSDVDYQRGRSVLLIEGSLDDLLHRATVLDPNFCVRNTSERKKESHWIYYTTNVPGTT